MPVGREFLRVDLLAGGAKPEPELLSSSSDLPDLTGKGSLVPQHLIKPSRIHVVHAQCEIKPLASNLRGVEELASRRLAANLPSRRRKAARAFR